MKHLKQRVAIVLFIAILLSLVNIQALENDTAEIIVSDITIAANPDGETSVVVPVLFKGNPGFAGMTIDFEIPNDWTISHPDGKPEEAAIESRYRDDEGLKRSIVYSYDEYEETWKQEGFWTVNACEESTGKGRLVIAHTNDFTSSGFLCWITYVIPEGIMSGEYTISPDLITLKQTSDSITNLADNVKMIPGTITVTGGQEPVASTVEVTPETGTAAVPTKAAVEAGNPTTVQMSAVVKNQIDGVMEGQSVTWGLQGNPEGVSISDSGLVTVDNTAAAGEITVAAKCGEASDTAVLTLTRETAQAAEVVADDQTVNVPTLAEEEKTAELTATVYDQYGVPMSGQPVAWTLVDAPAGVSLDGSTLTVTKDAQAGAVQIKAACGGYADTATVTIHKAAAVPEAVVIQRGGETVTSDSITIPQSGSNAVTYTAVVYDQYGAKMENPAVTWRLTRTGEGVSQKDGTVTVTPDAAAGTYTLEADCGGETAQVAISVAGITFRISPEILDDPVYGMTWGQIITEVSGTAVVGETEIKGRFFVLDRDTVPNAGRQSYRIGFTGGGYENITAQTGYVNILPQPVTVTGITAQDKPYDGGMDAVLTVSKASINGVVEGDSLTVDSATGAFGDKNAGNEKTVSISKIILGGADAANYTVGSLSQKETYASIKPKPVSVSGITAQDREYNGSTTVVLDYSGVTFAELVEGDELTVALATGAFVDKNAGPEKTVTVSGITLGGNDAGNYTVSLPTDVTATISRKAVTITGTTAQNKVYDGTTAAKVDQTGDVTTKIDGDDVSVQAGTAQFASADVGEDIPVTFSDFALTGADAGNYVLSGQPAASKANITKADYSGSAVLVNVNVMTQQTGALTGSLAASDFFSDEPAGAEIVKVEGATNNIMESVTVSDGKIAYASKTNLQTANEIAAYTVTISTQNYRDIYANLTFTTVDKTPVTVSGIDVADKTYDGNAATCTDSLVAQTVDGETVSVSGFTYTWKDSDGNFMTIVPKNAGTYSLTVAVEDAGMRAPSPWTLPSRRRR